MQEDPKPTGRSVRISGFCYVRNGFKFGYPFLESIRSALPVCDEWVVAVGDSSDGTREAIEQLHSPAIRIIDTVWDENQRRGGREFARQCSLALSQTTGSWLLHLQADEVIHEGDLAAIRRHIARWDPVPEVEGLLFDFLHFWGDYRHIRVSRHVPRREIRLMRKLPGLAPYRDSQGFRIYAPGRHSRGRKLRVKSTGIPVYHYNYVRNPAGMQQKMRQFHRYWHEDRWIDENLQAGQFDYSAVDELTRFEGRHPAVMSERIGQQDWQFEYEPHWLHYNLKDRTLRWLEQRLGYRLFEYRNYKLI